MDINAYCGERLMQETRRRRQGCPENFGIAESDTKEMRHIGFAQCTSSPDLPKLTDQNGLTKTTKDDICAPQVWYFGKDGYEDYVCSFFRVCFWRGGDKGRVRNRDEHTTCKETEKRDVLRGPRVL